MCFETSSTDRIATFFESVSFIGLWCNILKVFITLLHSGKYVNSGKKSFKALNQLLPLPCTFIKVLFYLE